MFRYCLFRLILMIIKMLNVILTKVDEDITDIYDFVDLRILTNVLIKKSGY